MMHPRARSAVLCSLFLTACGGGGETPPPDTTVVIPTTDSVGVLTPFQLEHGIGPVTEQVSLGTLDAGLAAKGKTAFETWCLTCHRLEEEFLGPPLGEVTTRRSPTYIMNMILDPAGMTERHPEAKALLVKYTTPMVKLVTSTDDARAIVEYLRTQAKGTVRTQ